MNEEALTNEIEEENFDLPVEEDDDVEIIATDEDTDNSNLVTAVKIGVGLALVGGLAIKGGKDLIVEKGIPVAKKVGSKIKSILPFGKKDKKAKKKSSENVVADVELSEEEELEGYFDDEEEDFVEE